MKNDINTWPLDPENNEITDIPPEFLLSTYSYDLPPELIAHSPVEQRDQSKLMRIDRNTGELEHRRFFELPQSVSGRGRFCNKRDTGPPALLTGKKLQGALFRSWCWTLLRLNIHQTTC